MSLKFVLLLSAAALLVTTASAACGAYQDGDTWNTGSEDCSKRTCEDGVEKRLNECPMYKVSYRCTRLPVPEGAVYPECCPKFTCPED